MNQVYVNALLLAQGEFSRGEYSLALRHLEVAHTEAVKAKNVPAVTDCNEISSFIRGLQRNIETIKMLFDGALKSS